MAPPQNETDEDRNRLLRAQSRALAEKARPSSSFSNDERDSDRRSIGRHSSDGRN